MGNAICRRKTYKKKDALMESEMNSKNDRKVVPKSDSKNLNKNIIQDQSSNDAANDPVLEVNKCKTFSTNPSSRQKNENNIKDQSKINVHYSISYRTTAISEFTKNPDFKMLSTYLNHAFTNNPSLAHINFIILTLLEFSEDAESTWEQFINLLTPCYEYIKNWKQEENSEKLYRRVISEMLSIIDHTYKKKGGSNISIVSTLIDEAQHFLPNLKHLPADQKLKNKCLQELFESVEHRANFELKKLEKKTNTLHYKYLKEFSILLKTFEQRNNILEGLKKCRFDKRDFNSFLSHSIILGADNGIYVLLNTLLETEKILLLNDPHINQEMLLLIMNEQGKIVIGEGSFGKIRMAIAIIPNKKTGTTLIGGSIICVKKAGSKKKAKDIKEIWDSTWNDYCSIDFLEDAPEIFDMKITKDCRKKQQGYCFQRLLMLPNGEIFKKNEEYQKWVHVKQYFIGIFYLMMKLHERGICMTDLKPANTLYDKKTRTAKLVDLAGAVRNENLLACKIKHVSELTIKYSAPELNDNDDPDYPVNLTKCISWTIGHMMEELCSKIKEFEEPIPTDRKIRRIKEEINSLTYDLKLKASDRISLEEGLKRLIDVPELENEAVKSFESYLNYLKKSFNSEDLKILEKLDLKKDIYILNKCFNDKLKVTERNPDENIYDFSTDASINDLLPALKKMLNKELAQEEKYKKEVVLLFGSAGSGKSTVLQKMFIEAAQKWIIGEPIPIFMNLAIHYDLKEYWKHLKNSFGLEDLQFEDLIQQPLLLFLDSLDESRMDLRVILNISDSLSTYANVNAVKMIVTCRTGYLNEKSEENRIKENIRFSLRYIIPLDHFFFNEQSNIEQLISLYLYQWESKSAKEIKNLVAIYLQTIKDFRLQEIMKTTYMLFMILAIMPKLMTIDQSSAKQKINFLTVYELYLVKNIENEMSRSTDEAIMKKNVAWFFKVGTLLAESMMLAKRATNHIAEEDTLKFLLNPLLAEMGENYNQKHPLTENVVIYNILRTLNLNIHFQKKPPHEEITLSFPHDTIKNYFLTKGFEQRMLFGNEFPEWVSQRLLVNDQNLIRFMVEAITSSSNSKWKSTFEIAILSTKNSEDPQVITRAANLITFLIASNHSFNGKDLSDIKIRGANISDGIFHGCNFDRADLSNVVLNNIKIDRASFKNTNLKDVIFDIYPYIEGHSDAVRSVAFSPDGKKVLSGSYDNTVRLWEVESGKELQKYEGHSNWVSSAAFSPDGKILVSGSDDNTVRLWYVENGKEIKKYEGHNGPVCSVAFSPDGRKVVSGGYDKTVRLWDLEREKEIKKYVGHSSWISSVAFSPDGKKVISGSNDKTVRLWDVESGKELKKNVGHCNSVNSVAFSSDGTKIASGGDDNKAIVWDLENGKEIRKYEGHSNGVRSVAFSKDGKNLVSGSDDNTVRLWDGDSGKELKKYEGHTNSVNSVAFSPSDGKKIVSGSDDNTVRIWDVANGNEPKKYEGHGGIVNTVVFSPDGKNVLSGSYDNTVRLWDIESGKELQKYDGHNNSVTSVAFSPDGTKMVSGSKDNTVRLWDVESGKELTKYDGYSDSANYSNWVHSVSFSPDGKKVVSGSHDKTVRLWDVISGKEIKKFDGHSFSVFSVAFFPDGKRIASGSEDHTIRLWDIENGNEIKKYEGHSHSVRSVALCSAGKIMVSGSSDKTIRLWDVETGKEIKKYEGHSSSVISVAFSSDGKKVVSGSNDKTVRLWDVENGKELKKYEVVNGPVNSVSFSPDGNKLVCASENLITFFSPCDVSDYNNLIISSCATAFSCLNCYNYENSLNTSSRLMSLFRQNQILK